MPVKRRVLARSVAGGLAALSLGVAPAAFKRRLTLLIAAVVCAAGVAVPLASPHIAFALDDCRQATGSDPGNTNGTGWSCPYTQSGGAAWPGDPGYVVNPPQCYAGGYACVSWCRCSSNGGPGNVPAAINGVSNDSRAAFYNDLKAAMQNWAGEPYNSPFVYLCTNCSSSQIQLVMQWGSSSDPNWCAMTHVDNTDANNLVLHVTVTLNSSPPAPFYDGPPPPGKPGCDVKATSLHELGHAIGTLGHSSNTDDAMYWRGGAESIGKDDEAGLDAIYGPYDNPNGQGDGGSSCPNCQTICGQADNPCHPTGGVDYEGYLEKAWDMSQGVPMPNPVSLLSSWDGCLQYALAKNYLGWFNCEVAIDT